MSIIEFLRCKYFRLLNRPGIGPRKSYFIGVLISRFKLESDIAALFNG